MSRLSERASLSEINTTTTASLARTGEQRRADIEVLNIGLAQKRDLLLDITQRHDFMVLNATVVAAMGTCVIWTIPIDLEEAEKKNQEHRE